jgi:hypothetical protein
MHAQRRLGSLAGISLLLLLFGCASPGPTQSAPVAVHVVNRISSVVVTSPFGPALPGLRSPASDSQSFVAPCGGQADVQAPNENGTGGLLALLIDPTGVLDQAYPRASLGSLDARFSGEIIWSSGELNPGDWIVVDPGGVTVTTTPPASMSVGSCGSWIGEPKAS